MRGNMKLTYICKICGKECNGICGLMTHAKLSHNISNKDYYDSYLKINPELCDQTSTVYQ